MFYPPSQLRTMALNKGKVMEYDDYPSSDDDSFKSFESDSPISTKVAKQTPKTQPSSKPADTVSIDLDEPNQASTASKLTPSKPQDSQRELSTSSKTPPPQTKPPTPERFPPEEEASLLSESNTIKQQANTLFGTASYENAVQTYDRALALCPNYLDYEISVLRSNVAACHLKLSEWKQCAEAATKGLDCLERLEKLPVVRAAGKKKEDGQAEGEGDVVEEVDEDLEARIENLRQSGHTLASVRKLQSKLLTRRAKAKTELGGWSNLQAADEDYRVLLSPVMEAVLSATDKRNILEKVRTLGPMLNKAKEQEMAEMMGKLKGLGNTFLKPFGLSTENFKFEQDAKTGGYSMNFDQNAGKK
jgi:tetratricopeptide (TPR) repeat protein